MDAPIEVVNSVENAAVQHDDPSTSRPALTPPTSEDLDKREERMSSELSELESEDDDEEIEPDHYFEGGKIPVFKPTMDQFRNFKRFIDKIDKHGMKSGIVKVIPPTEWRKSLPDLSEAIKSIKVKNPITQEFAGQHGIYTQANIEKQRSYNLPEWKSLTNEAHHQPPAKRGERRKAVIETPSRVRSTRAQASVRVTESSTTNTRRGPGRPRRRAQKIEEDEDDHISEKGDAVEVPPTPKSPSKEDADKNKRASRAKIKEEEGDNDATPVRTKGRQPKSTASRRMNNRTAMADTVDEKAFDEFDYHLSSVDEYTVERCKDLEDNYWKTINFGQPMYGADMPGSLFDDRTTSWNVAKLPNLLDVLGTKVPGVNTAYLYLGMWKATFAWHLEDVDLYSINYIHFGAPKQWYSISQEDARRFEAAMKSIWPRDAKNCSQFLRHKTYLISPSQLEKQFNIKVNRLVHYEGEFVITYPYGYHSGYNLGYNCAESVNFANEAWLSYGRIAKKCECESDSVWVDVNEIERKLRGEPTPEYYEETDDEDEDEDAPGHLPSPAPTVTGKSKAKPGRKPAANKRKRANEEPKEAPKAKKVKRIRIRIKIPGRGMPCCLCPNDVEFDELLPTDNGLKAHRTCADYTPETFISAKPNEVVRNVANIGKDRLDLKCNYCRSKRGAVFQCSAKKCTRAFHATCAAAAGVQVDLGPMPTFDESGTEYYYDGYDFRCRYHRPKKRNAKKVTSDTLESDKFIMRIAKSLKPRDVVQFQYLDAEMYQMYGGLVIENRPGEGTVLVEVLPDGDRVEVEWKYLLALDPTDSERPKPSANAKPLPDHLKESDASLAITNRTDGVPQKDDPFLDPNAVQKWAEFHTAPEVIQKVAKVDIAKPERLWYYLGKTSTEARPQYTEHPANIKHNPKSNFLDTVRPVPLPIPPVARHSYSASYPIQPAPSSSSPRTPTQAQIRPGERILQYKPKAEPAVYKSPIYNPDTVKNPNSPVAHQPNVVYDHRTAAPQYSYPSHSPAYHHHHRPPPVFHHYTPPQSNTTWKASSTNVPLLGGIDQYAQHKPPPPPYPYDQSRSVVPNPPRPLSSFSNVQPSGQHLPYSPVGPPTTSAQAHGPSGSNSVLAPNVMSGSAGPKSPIPNGGFTPEWMPKPTAAVGSNAHPPRPPPPYGGPTTNLPSSRPLPQFQSADAFQRDIAKTPGIPNDVPRWESMMKQLASSTGNSSHATTPTQSIRPSPVPVLQPSNFPHTPPIQSNTPPMPQPAEPQRPTKSPIRDESRSPKRPEYSPISDDGKEPSLIRPIIPPLHSGETWRF